MPLNEISVQESLHAAKNEHKKEVPLIEEYFPIIINNLSSSERNKELTDKQYGQYIGKR